MLRKMKHAFEIAPIAMRTITAQLIPGFHANKVFAIGFNKTGTTSIHRLFESYGYRSCHAREWRDTHHQSIFMKYEAFSDGIPDDFRRLDRLYPKSKFILNVRDLDTWIDSRIEYIKHKYPQGVEVWDPFSDWNTFRSSMLEWILHRNRHHAQVLSYFASRPQSLITINYCRDTNAGEKISRFLHKPTLSKKPHDNAGPASDHRLRNQTQTTKLLKYLNVCETEWSNDIFCPSIDGIDADFIPVDTNLLDSNGHWLK